MRVMRVANVEAAIELAADLKRDGEYDWFRGQVQGWHPASSLQRRLLDGTATQESCLADMEAFVGWASTVPELAYIAREGGEDAAFAILQHHGVPTQYVDFTTEPSVAGFFSAHAEVAPEPGTESVILCLQTQDLLDFYERYRELDPKLQLDVVATDVSNLWRLQAQRGCFIFANHDWYKIYPLDRIVFPWSGHPAYPQHDQVFPLHKSSLERRIDEYFSLRERRAATAHAREMTRGRGVVWLEMTSEDGSASAVGETLEWPQALLEHWSQYSIERYDDAVGRHATLNLRRGPNAPPVSEQVLVGVSSMLRREEAFRDNAMDWRFMGLPDDDLANRLAQGSRTLWNGLRRLPASDEDLAHAFATLVELFVVQPADARPGDRRAAELVFDAPLYLEFGTTTNVVSRGCCSGSGLWDAMYAPLKVPEGGEGHRGITRVLRSNSKPSQVFAFEQFARVFVRQIVPSQVVLGRNPIIFNPAELCDFGLP